MDAREMQIKSDLLLEMQTERWTFFSHFWKYQF